MKKMKWEICCHGEVLALAPSKKEARRIIKEELLINGTKTLDKIRKNGIVLSPIKKRS